MAPENHNNEALDGLADSYDVVLIGAGLAGLSLAQHLLRETDKTVLLLERRPAIPPPRQKVGESLVQVAGYYFSRVLDMEEYLFREHYLKYNLRFYWPSEDRDNSRFEDYGKAYIRPFSNLASYQLDRNTFEGELLRRNLTSDRFAFRAPVKVRETDLAEEGPHRISFTDGDGVDHEVKATWVVDTSGRGKVLTRKKGLAKENSIRHGAFFWWVDGLVDVDKLTDLPQSEIRKKAERRFTGHLPSWLATNHFMGEGFWFWVIPLQGKTSLGLVYDHQLISHDDVFSTEKATRWACERFPLLARDLPNREVLDFAGYRDFSYDCVQTISPERWAMTGESGRFTDPLYSPGSDLIAIYNTLIVDAIANDHGDGQELAAKCQRYEQLMRSVYSAYVPSYATSYDALGDQEVFCLKYTWELAVYFAYYVFPFINDLFTDKRFSFAFMRLFARLGPINNGIQELLSDYFQWKKDHHGQPREPVYFDFMELAPLRRAEETFYQVGVTVEEAKTLLAEQLESLKELARFAAVHVASEVLEDPSLVTNRRFVETIDVESLAFDPEAWAAARRESLSDGEDGSSREPFAWTFPANVMERFRQVRSEAHSKSLQPRESSALTAEAAG